MTVHNPHTPIVLASTSPRRHQLLKLSNYEFSTLAVDIDEAILANEHPKDYILRMVGAKAKVACSMLVNESKTPEAANAQDISGKKTSKIEVSKLDISTSQAPTSKVPISQVSIPKVAIPKVAIPKVAIPKVAIPKVAIGLDAPKVSTRLAVTSKAKYVANKTSHQSESGFVLVITADTIGVLPDGESVLVKPKDKADAFAMWLKMSGKTHQVWTAVQLTLMNTHNEIMTTDVLLEKTEVTFVTLTVQMMQSYWQTGEPADKAGGYAIQGIGGTWVERINGSYTNVVGLPLSQTIAAINKMLLLTR